jgi:hypothetical protein
MVPVSGCCYFRQMSSVGNKIFEVLPAPGGRFIVMVNLVAITEHSCPIRAAAHCERLRLRDGQAKTDRVDVDQDLLGPA